MALKRVAVAYPWVAWQPDFNSNNKPWHVCPFCQEAIEEPNLKGRRMDRHMEATHPERVSWKEVAQ